MAAINSTPTCNMCFYKGKSIPWQVESENNVSRGPCQNICGLWNLLACGRWTTAGHWAVIHGYQMPEQVGLILGQTYHHWSRPPIKCPGGRGWDECSRNWLMESLFIMVLFQLPYPLTCILHSGLIISHFFYSFIFITSGLCVFTNLYMYVHLCLCRSLVNSLKAWRPKMLPCSPSLPVVPFWVFISFSRWVYVLSKA